VARLSNKTKFPDKELQNMAGIKDFQIYEEDFIGASVTLPTSANIGTPWTTTVTGAAPPTHVRAASELVLTLTSANEAQILGTSHADALSFDIDDIQSVEMRVRFGASTITSGTIFAFGVGSARNNTLDSVAANAWFRMEGANSTTLVYCETDDGVRDVDDISSGIALGTTYKRFVIDFTGGKSDVKFYIDGQRVAASQTFDMSGYSSGLQPIIQLQKAANTNADTARVDYFKVTAKRS
jgi:hypothetical protein